METYFAASCGLGRISRQRIGSVVPLKITPRSFFLYSKEILLTGCAFPLGFVSSSTIFAAQPRKYPCAETRGSSEIKRRLLPYHDASECLVWSLLTTSAY